MIVLKTHKFLSFLILLTSHNATTDPKSLDRVDISYMVYFSFSFNLGGGNKVTTVFYPFCLPPAAKNFLTMVND